MKLVKEFEANK